MREVRLENEKISYGTIKIMPVAPYCTTGTSIGLNLLPLRHAT